MYQPKHKQPVKSPEYLLAEAADLQAFADRKPTTLRGQHHHRAAQTIIRVQEIAHRARLTRQGVAA